MRLQQDFVLIEMIEAADKTAGGILLPATSPTPFREGKVIAAGPGTWVGGAFVDVNVAKGDTVTFHSSAGIPYKDGNRLIKFGDIIEVA